MFYRIQFNPLVHAAPPDGTELRQVFSQEGIDPTFEIGIRRQPSHIPKGVVGYERQVIWSVEVPAGAFTLAFRSAGAPPMLHQFEALAARAKQALQASRVLYDRRRDAIETDGVLFCRRSALELIQSQLEKPAYVNALIAFLRAAERDPQLVTGAPRARRPRHTVAERIERFGAATKGPAWTPEEDTILRTWFGIRTIGEHAGRHAKLEDSEWERVLELLSGMRTKNAVKNRLTVLNNQLRDRMLVNGFVPRDRLREYMQQALGEAPRRPPMRPYPRMGRSRRKDVPASREVATTERSNGASV